MTEQGDSTWEIYVRRADGELVAEIDDFKEANIVSRHNAVGAWSIIAPRTAASTKLAADGMGIRFVRNGQTVLEGPMTQRRRILNDTTDAFEITGADDLLSIGQRIILPAAGSGYDTSTGSAGGVIADLVNRHAGPAAGARAVPNLTVATGASIGPAVAVQARYDNLLSFVTAIAEGADIGIRVRARVFEVFALRDRTAPVKFSTEMGNLASYEYLEKMPSLNDIYVAGQGELEARVVLHISDPTSIGRWGLIESFRDARDLVQVPALLRRGADVLAQGALSTGVKLEALETPGTSYIDDYAVGDIVTVNIDGSVFTDVVREVAIKLDDAGEKIQPTIGNVDRSPTLDLFARLAQAVRNLESRQ